MSKLGTYVKFGRDLWRSRRWKAVTACGSDCVAVALYFMTAPNSNMTGIFEATMHDICRHTNLTPSKVTAAIRALERVGFCRYDEEMEFVWEVGAIDRFLADRPNQNQIKGMRNSFARLATLDDAPFVDEAREHLFKGDTHVGHEVAPDGDFSFDTGR